MKARVKVNLNERGIKPSVNAPNDAYYKPGDIIKIEDIVNGDTYEGNNVWYKLDNGRYVWSGGVEGIKTFSHETEVEEEIIKPIVKKHALDWWHIDYGIDKIWEEYGTMGEGVNVAIVDSGISINEHYFDKNRIRGIRFDGDSNFDDNSNIGHGTKIASILAANGKDYIGVAPYCNLFACKYYTDLKNVTNLIKALELIPESIDIVVISSGFISDEIKNENEKLKAVISHLAQTKIVLCSVGNDSNHDDNPFSRYPASYSNTISIGSVNKNGIVSGFSTKSNELNLLAPGEEIKTFNFIDNRVDFDSGTSFSTPFVAGVICLAKSIYPNISNSSITNALMQSLDKKENSQMYGEGIINPPNFIKQLKSI